MQLNQSITVRVPYTYAEHAVGCKGRPGLEYECEVVCRCSPATRERYDRNYGWQPADGPEVEVMSVSLLATLVYELDECQVGCELPMSDDYRVRQQRWLLGVLRHDRDLIGRALEAAREEHEERMCARFE